ncbi:cupin domain-containing protein [Halomonas salifodinae]|uniref:cupin domain-containing protein n=1 Tax=Halomonas salifodinae TaxID=438745 RepID=UPI0033BB1B84
MKTISLSGLTLLLTLTLGLASAPAQAELPYQGEGHLITHAENLSWGPVASMGEGAEIAVIEGAMSEPAPFTIRLRLADGYEIRPHVHPAYERVTVLQGTVHFAHGETFDRAATTALRPGDLAIMAPGVPMFGYAEGESIIQLHGEGPWGIEYLDPADDPRQ